MVAYFSNWLVLFPIAFSLFIAWRLAMVRANPGFASWNVIAVRGLIALMFLFALLAIGLRPSPLSLFWMGLLAVYGTVVLLKNRRLARLALLLSGLEETDQSRQRALVGYFFQENSGWLRRRARQLGRDLETGVPWDLALERRGVARSVYERVAVRLCRAVGPAHPKAIESVPRSMATPLQIEAEAERLLGRLLIFSWAVFVPAIVALIVTFILPTFRQMFEEFGMQIPASTRLLLDVSSFVNRYGLGYVIAAGTLGLGGIAMLLVLIWLFPSWLQHPLLRWFGQAYYRNAGFTVLATLLSQGKDVLAACRETVAILPVNYVANQFAAASKLMEQGATSSTAFRKTRLLSKRECQACGLDLPSVDPGWALQELAAWKVERMLSRYSLIVQATVVTLTAILAVIIGLVAVALIGALATMIESLA